MLALALFFFTAFIEFSTQTSTKERMQKIENELKICEDDENCNNGKECNTTNYFELASNSICSFIIHI